MNVVENDATQSPRRRPTPWSKLKILIRRIHLYAGLFMLPWVFLYGITGAMYNHVNLLPHVTVQPVDSNVLDDSPMENFPPAEEFAQQVVDALQASSGDRKISLAKGRPAEFTGAMMFEINKDGIKHVVQIDPISRSSQVLTHPKNEEALEPLLDLHNIALDPDPHSAARQSAPQVLAAVGIDSASGLKPLGWTKLNFLANVDDELARVTYVLKDGHVDVTKYTGEDGMNLRHFFLRMHTTHGQTPHWNGKMFWSIAIDVMAISMVCWGLTGLFMWWQLKRTRLIGTVIIGLSVLTAAAMYLSLHDFYATTQL